jgi:hypothetical protein
MIRLSCVPDDGDLTRLIAAETGRFRDERVFNLSWVCVNLLHLTERPCPAELSRPQQIIFVNLICRKISGRE